MSTIPCVRISLPLPLNNSRFAAVYELGPLVPGGTGYNPPLGGDGGKQRCDCNTVMYRYMTNLRFHPEQALIVEVYSLFMMCTLCQNVTAMSWKTWSNSCLSVEITQFVNDINPDYPVPNWAFLDYSVRTRHRWWA